jgi:hypothetical protein
MRIRGFRALHASSWWVFDSSSGSCWRPSPGRSPTEDIRLTGSPKALRPRETSSPAGGPERERRLGHRRCVGALCQSSPLLVFAEHPDEHRPEHPILLAVDQELPEGSAPSAPKQSDDAIPRDNPLPERARGFSDEAQPEPLRDRLRSRGGSKGQLDLTNDRLDGSL